jgi:two-component system, OmpR family, response regulator
MDRSTDDSALRVLCVDDDRDAADSLAVLLELAGFQPHVCYDGPCALAAVETFQPEACILDLTMPGMSGLELSRRIREWAGRREPPILVALTGWTGEEARRRTAEAGFDLYLTKPVDPDHLAALVTDMVILRSGPLTHLT